MLTATVDLRQLKRNINAIKRHVSPQKFLLPIKANAYGHGAIEVARFVEIENIVDYLGVAHFSEALTLRTSDITLPILVLSPSVITKDEICTAAKYGIELTISSPEQALQYNQWLVDCDHTLQIHIFVDTGMGREGAFVVNVAELCKAIESCPHLTWIGSMTHLARADETGHAAQERTLQQLKNYNLALEVLQLSSPDAMTSVLNSGGCAQYSREVAHDMIRPGLSSYGYDPCGVLDVTPIMQITAPLTLIKKYPDQFPIGYGGTYQTTQGELLGIVPVGYGDGLARHWGSFAPLLHGDKRLLRGRVSMDQIMITCTPQDTPNDNVTLLGPTYTAQEIADDVDTIPYEILTALGNGPRITHKYVS